MTITLNILVQNILNVFIHQFMEQWKCRLDTLKGALSCSFSGFISVCSVSTVTCLHALMFKKLFIFLILVLQHLFSPSV